jgi:hypothetical protein
MTLPPLLTGLIAALGVSLGGNALLGKLYLNQRDNTRTALSQADRNLEVARQCTAGVQSLEVAAAEQKRESDRLIAEAQSKALEARKRAVTLGTRPATKPGDDCGSAQDRIDRWMRER